MLVSWLIPRADSDVEKRLPKEHLYAVSKMAAVQTFVRRSDYAFYQALVEVLIPDVLRPIPSEYSEWLPQNAGLVS